jgi:SAM-dependent methyltransferase
VDLYDEVAEDYERLRPGYPLDFVADVLADAAVPAGGTVADVGAGTGRLGSVLAALGLRVAAVEPTAGMRARLPAGVAALGGTAERLPFASGSLDAVVAGQAWHWFDEPAAAAAAHRVLRPGGVLLVVTNVLDTSAAWAAPIERLRRGRPVTQGPLDPAGAAAGRWRAGGERDGGHVHRVPTGSVADLVLTTSSLAGAGEPARAAVRARVQALGAEYGLLDRAEVDIPFRLRARWLVRA